MKRTFLYVLVFICGGLLIPLAMHQVGTSKRISILEADGTTHYVPDAVVNNKDCEAFRTWRDGLTKPEFAPTAIPCPWAPKPKGIGKFALNGVELHIPREYLWQGSEDPDGPAKDNTLYLMVSYPSMQPASADGDQKHNIKISLRSGGAGGETEVLGKKVRVKSFQSGYLIRANLSNPLMQKTMPIFIKKLKHIGLDYYEVESIAYEKDVFVKGDPITPDEWVICEHNFNSRCYSEFEIGGTLGAAISYRQFPNFEHYQELHPAIKKLIQSFVQTKGE